jgi:hypothetical protein
MIMTDGLNLIRDALANGTSIEIKYLAWGSSNAALSVNQHTLGAEFGRKAVTAQVAGATGILDTTTYISPSEANTPKIEEIGWFAGPTATAVANTGILVARVLYSKQKTNLESIQSSRTDTLTDVTLELPAPS